MNKLLILVLILASSFTENLFSQVTLEWKNLYNDTITYNGSSQYYSNDIGKVIAKDNSGNIYVSGVCSARIQSNDYGRIVTIKYQSNGQIIWKSVYPAAYQSSTIDMQVYSLNLDNSGNLIISGRRLNNFILVKYSNSGNQEWVRDSMETVNNSTIYISDVSESGYIYTSFKKPNSSSYDIFTRKYDPNGIVLWTRSFDGTNHLEDKSYCIDVDKNENVIIGGFVTSSNGRDFCTLKYDATGNLLWSKMYDIGDEVIYGMTCDTLNNIYVTGTLLTTFPNHEICTIKYDPNGIEKWVSRYAGRTDYLWNEPFDIAVDNSGNVFVTGFTERGYPYSDYVTLKYNSLGVQQWVTFYNGNADRVDIATGIDIDNSGNIFITGISEQNNVNYATVKYNQSGIQQWVHRIDSVASSNWLYPVIITDNNSNVFVLGANAYYPNYSFDYLFVKYHQVIGITNISSEIPAKYSLYQNYPNPFNPVTNIEFDITTKGNVKLLVFDIQGREILTLVNKELIAGSYNVDWDASNYSSGVYFYKLETSDFVETKRMILVK